MFRSGFIMKPVFAQAKAALKRVIYAEGEDERILRATQVVVEEGLAQPILIGRPAVVEARLERFGLSIRPGRDFELINPEDDPRYRDYVAGLCRGRRPQGRHAGRGAHAGAHQRHRHRGARGAAAAMADAMICGVEGRYMAPSRATSATSSGLRPGVARSSRRCPW